MSRGIPVPVIGAGAGAGLWLWAGQPGQLRGLALAVAGVSAAVPLLLLAVCFGAPALAMHLLTRRHWRAGYRAWLQRGAWWRRPVPRERQISARIWEWLDRAIVAADRGKCLYCGRAAARRYMNIDHGTPWAWGGLTWLGNLFLLCRRHNLIKHDYWVDRHGIEHGHSSDPDKAWEIICAERRALWNVLRWLRAARSLGWIWLIPV